MHFLAKISNFKFPPPCSNNCRADFFQWWLVWKPKEWGVCARKNYVSRWCRKKDIKKTRIEKKYFFFGNFFSRSHKISTIADTLMPYGSFESPKDVDHWRTTAMRLRGQENFLWRKWKNWGYRFYIILYLRTHSANFFFVHGLFGAHRMPSTLVPKLCP